MYEIFSFGDAATLAQVYNGLAALVNGASFNNMLHLAFLVGILAFGARAAMTNQFNAIPLLSSLIAVAVMFTPRTTVLITDVYTGQVYPVANVPVGVAAPQYVVSRVGNYLTRTMETAFMSTTNTGYLGVGLLDSLNVLLRMRDISAGAANSTNTADGDIERSITNYITTCVMYDMQLPGSNISQEKILKSPSAWDAMASDLINRYVDIFIPGSTGSYSCQNAYNIITAYVNNGAWVPGAFDNAIRTKIGVPLNTTVYNNAELRIQNALDGVRLSSLRSRDFMLNSFYGNLYRQAQMGYTASNNDVASTIILTEASNKRNVQWATERTMFEKAMRPMISFIEIFMVGSAPIMAFAIAAFGAMGFGALGKFMLAHAWVMLWNPALALANLYTYNQAGKWADYANLNALDAISISGLDLLNDQLQTAFATGSMIAASTPILAGMLIWGASTGVAHFANKIASSHTANPEVAAPSIYSPSSLIQGQSGFSGNPAMAFGVTGATKPVGSWSSAAVAQVASLSSQRDSATASANKSVESAFNALSSAGTGLKFDQKTGFSATGGSSESRAAVLNELYKTALAHTNDSSRAMALTIAAERAWQHAFIRGFGGQFGASAQGGVASGSSPSAGGGGASTSKGARAGFNAGAEYFQRWLDTDGKKLASDLGIKTSDVMQFMKAVDTSASKDSRLGATLNQMFSTGYDYAKGTTINTQQTATALRNYSSSMAEAAERTRQISDIQTASKSSTLSASYEPQQFAHLLDSNATDWTALDKAWNNSYGGDSKAQRERLAAAQMKIAPALASMNPTDRERVAKAWLMAFDADSRSALQFAQALGLNGSSTMVGSANVNANANRGVGDAAPQFASVRSEVDAKTAQAASTLSSAQLMYATTLAGAGEINARATNPNVAADGYTTAQRLVDIRENPNRVAVDGAGASNATRPAQNFKKNEDDVSSNTARLLQRQVRQLNGMNPEAEPSLGRN